MDTWQILFTLRNVNSFFDVFPLIYYHRQVQSRNTVSSSSMPIAIQMEVSYWLAIRLSPYSSSAYYNDSYGIVTLLPSIQAFVRRNCSTLDYNKKQLQTSDVCGQYCCLFVRYMDRSYTPSNSSRFSPVAAIQNDRWSRCSCPKLGPPCRVAAGVNAAAAAYKS